jgi:hypothetical protein
VGESHELVNWRAAQGNVGPVSWAVVCLTESGPHPGSGGVLEGESSPIWVEGTSATRCEECKRICGKSLPGCAHTCPLRCHPGSCTSCSVTTTRMCFCGQTQLQGYCHTLTEVRHLSFTASSKPKSTALLRAQRHNEILG